MFFANIKSCVLGDDMLSDCFHLSRGVRQGDPLSSHLFLLAIEILAISIRQNQEIK